MIKHAKPYYSAEYYKFPIVFDEVFGKNIHTKTLFFVRFSFIYNKVRDKIG